MSTSIDELLVYGYIHDTIETEFFFNTNIILPNAACRAILRYCPKARRLKISVSSGPCIVSKHANKKYTLYTLKFKIFEETHIFTARYSSLHSFHEQLFKEQAIQQAFHHHSVAFPAKNWWKDYTKPENYHKRSKAILKYFQTLVQSERVLKSHTFQNGIYLDKHLRQILSSTVRGYYWPPLPTLPVVKAASDSLSPLPLSPSSPISSRILTVPTLSDKLNEILRGTDESFMDCQYVSNEREWYTSMNHMYYYVDSIRVFSINDVLPKHLRSERADDNAMETVSMPISVELFRRMSKQEIQALDDILLDVRDAILESCDVLQT